MVAPLLSRCCILGTHLEALLLDWAKVQAGLHRGSHACICLLLLDKQPSATCFVTRLCVCKRRHYSRRFSPTDSTLWTWSGHELPVLYFILVLIIKIKPTGVSPDITALIGVQHQDGEMKIGPEKRLYTILQPYCIAERLPLLVVPPSLDTLENELPLGDYGASGRVRRPV